MGDPPAVARDIAEEHEEMGEAALLASLAILGLAGLAWAPKKPIAAGSAWAAFAAAGGLSYWIVSTAHLGGTLVYDFGVGTPKPVTERDLAPGAGAVEWDPRVEFFRAEVRPILARYCFSCHGSSGRPAGGLRMTTAADILQGGETGPAIIPGDAATSLLYRAISGDHPDLSMPPGPRQPSEADIAAIRRWIDAGAVWAPPESEAE
jgi:mono/diheme cytochrome c family protein